MSTNEPDQEVVATEAVAENSAVPVEGTARRRLLFGGMAAAVSAIATACSDDDDDTTPTEVTGPTPSNTTADSSQTTDPGDGAASGTTEPDGGAEGTSEPDDEVEGGSSDGKNQEADVPVREGDADGGRDPNNPTATEASAELAQDLATIAFAAGLEFLAVDTYRRTSQAASAGALGPVPPAVGEFVVTVMGHHQAVLDELNRALLLSGEPAVAAPNAELQPVVDDALAGAMDVPAAARLALMLEEVAAATYLAAIPTLKSPEAIGLAASVYPIDMQHASVLHFVLGEYPVPDVFGTVTKAASPG